MVDPYSLSGNLALRVTLDERIAMICRYPSGVASITGFTLGRFTTPQPPSGARVNVAKLE